MKLHIIAGATTPEREQTDTLLAALREYEAVRAILARAGIGPGALLRVEELVDDLLEIVCDLQMERAEQRIRQAALRLL